MNREEFGPRFEAALFNRGAQKDAAALVDYAWASIAQGKPDIQVDVALHYLEKHYSRSDKRGSVDEAAAHAGRERPRFQQDPVKCELCGGHGWVVLPMLYSPGTYKLADTVEAKTITMVKGGIMNLQRYTCFPVGIRCACYGGQPAPQAILDTWRDRKDHLEILGRYETLAEWALREAHFIVDEMLPADLVQAAEFPGRWHTPGETARRTA